MDNVARRVGAISDGELLQRARAGDREAFGVFYERRHELVLAFLLKRTRNPEVAMDLMAETFAAALLALADRPPVTAGSAAPWLLTIARNSLIDSYRRGQVESAARRRLALEPVQITDCDVDRVLGSPLRRTCCCVSPTNFWPTSSTRSARVSLTAAATRR